MGMFDGIETDGNYEQESGGALPNNTTALAFIKDAAWKEYEGDRYIQLNWSVLKPEKFKNRIVFQKLKVNDPDNKKAEKAKKMLSAVDYNCGGKLKKVTGDVTDLDLASCLTKGIMGIKIMKWQLDDKEGNWISAVSAKAKAAAKDIKLPEPEPEIDPDEDDDSIPF